MKKILFSVVLVASLAFMGTVRAETTASSIQAQIEAILAQIRQIQSQINQAQGNVPASSGSSNNPSGESLPNTTGLATCHVFNYNLGTGSVGNEVRYLQYFLTYDATPNGAFMLSDFDGKYDEDVAADVVDFQSKYGIRKTGYVGPITRTKLNSLYGSCKNDNRNSSTTVTISKNSSTPFNQIVKPGAKNVELFRFNVSPSDSSVSLSKIAVEYYPYIYGDAVPASALSNIRLVSINPNNGEEVAFGSPVGYISSNKSPSGNSCSSATYYTWFQGEPLRLTGTRVFKLIADIPENTSIKKITAIIPDFTSPCGPFSTGLGSHFVATSQSGGSIVWSGRAESETTSLDGEAVSLLKLNSPYSGEVVRGGSQYTIRWEATAPILSKYPTVDIVLVGTYGNGCDPYGCGMLPTKSFLAKFVNSLFGVKTADAQQQTSEMVIAKGVPLNQGSYVWSVPSNISKYIYSYDGKYKIFFNKSGSNPKETIYPYTDNLFRITTETPGSTTLPTVSFTASNGTNSVTSTGTTNGNVLYVNVGDHMNYKWNTNGDYGSSSFTVSGLGGTCWWFPTVVGGKAPWVVNSTNGIYPTSQFETDSALVTDCQAGHTFYITFTGTNSAGSSSATVEVRVNSATTTSPVPAAAIAPVNVSDVNIYDNGVKLNSPIILTSGKNYKITWSASNVPANGGFRIITQSTNRSDIYGVLNKQLLGTGERSFDWVVPTLPSDLELKVGVESGNARAYSSSFKISPPTSIPSSSSSSNTNTSSATIYQFVSPLTITPNHGPAGSSVKVTIAGEGLKLNASDFAFGSYNPENFKVLNSNEVSFTVPQNIPAGYYDVVWFGGSNVLSSKFNVANNSF